MPSIGTNCALECLLKDNCLKTISNNKRDEASASASPSSRTTTLFKDTPLIYGNSKHALQTVKRNYLVEKLIQSVHYEESQGQGCGNGNESQVQSNPSESLVSQNGTQNPEFNIKNYVNEGIKSWQVEIQRISTNQFIKKEMKTNMKQRQPFKSIPQTLELEFPTSDIDPKCLTSNVTSRNNLMRENGGRSTLIDKKLRDKKPQNGNSMLKFNVIHRPMSLLKLVDIDMHHDELNSEEPNGIYNKVMHCVSKETAFQFVHGGKVSSKDDFKMLEKSFKDVHGELDYKKLISEVQDGWKFMKLEDMGTNMTDDDVPSLISGSSCRI